MTLLAAAAPGLAQGSVQSTNGSGVNPLALDADVPVPGTAWTLRVDSSAFPGAEQTFVEARVRSAPAIPSVRGEVLLDRTSPRLFSSTAAPVDGLAQHVLRIPPDPWVPGYRFSVQAAIGSLESRLTNALEVQVGEMVSPTAEFAPFPVMGITPHTVSFKDLTQGTVATWSWDFGDGRTSNDPTPVHTYTTAGTYTVSLTVAGPAGGGVRTRSNVIHVATPLSSIQPGVNLEVSRLESLNPEDSPTADVLDLTPQVIAQYANPIPGWAYAELAKPISYGHVLAMIYKRTTVGPSVQKQLVEVDASGQVVWQFDPRPHRVHHDFERLANGNTLALTQQPELHQNINPSVIFNDYILEADGNGTQVWSWSMADHWDDLPFTALERSYLATFPGSPAPIFHTNSMASLPPNQWEATDSRFAQGNILLSLRETNKLMIVERSTGDVVWSYTGTIAQHHAHMIPQGLAGAGNLLVFDNGGTSGAPSVTRNHSRIVEIDPITLEEVWCYEDPGVFFSNVMGGAQRLPNGNTLITESFPARVFEIDPGSNTLWSFTRPSLLPVYRTYRVDASWLTSPISFAW